MELDNIVEGQPEARLKAELEALQPPAPGASTKWRAGSSIRERVQLAYSAAREYLDSPALLTDAYFLFTPSQIVFASLQLADPPLADWYLSTKIPASSPIRPKVLATLRSCGEMLSSFLRAVCLRKTSGQRSRRNWRSAETLARLTWLKHTLRNSVAKAQTRKQRQQRRSYSASKA